MALHAIVTLSVLLLAELVEGNVIISSSPSCPCTLNGLTLLCDYVNVTHVPTACFDEFHGIDSIDLHHNLLTEIIETNFDAVASTIKVLDLSYNSISYMHPRAFSNLFNLTSLNLQYNSLIWLPENMLINNPSLNTFTVDYNSLIDLPLSLFSPSMQQGLHIYAYPNPLDSIPCSLFESLPPVTSGDLSYFKRFWAGSNTEKDFCQSFGLYVNVTNCRPFGMSGIDCSVVPEALTPIKASMAVSECKSLYYFPVDIIFKADLDQLIGAAPPSLDCLPEGFDITGPYRLYYLYATDIVIETIYFDLIDLPRYTSTSTNTVTIRADTVVLTGSLQPLKYSLTIVARKVILENPLLMSVNLAAHPPDTSPHFYVARQERGRVGDVIVERLEHGFVSVLLLQGKVDPENDCQPLPDWTVETEEWVKASQLWLSLYCANAVLEKENVTQTQEEAEEITHFILNITTDWTTPAHIIINQRAVKLLQDTNLQRQGHKPGHAVPYLTVSVYADMVSYLTENLELYKVAMDNLKLKMELNAERMFDKAIGFQQRSNDLHFIQSNAEDAVGKAQAILGAHQNQLSNLYQETSAIWDTIIDANNKLMQSQEEVETAKVRVDEGMKAYKKRRRFLSFLDYASMVVDVTLGFLNPVAAGFETAKLIFDTVKTVAEFEVSFIGRELEISRMAEAIDELMFRVDAIIAMAPPEPPAAEDMADWLQSFNSTKAIVEVATNFSTSRTQWVGVRETLNIVLDDEEMSDAVDGVRQLKMAIYDLTVNGQALSEQIVIFANLVISINQQMSVIEDEEVAVSNSQEDLAAAVELIEDPFITEENYLEYMVSQNLALAKLMTQLYLKSRSDMLAAFNVLGEYCNAFFYTFMKECPTQASFADDYTIMLYKLKQLDVLALNAIGSLDPPPQPFQMTFDIYNELDDEDCQELTEDRCPITQLAYTGQSKVVLSDWWGEELHYLDRVRIDRLKFYFEGLEESTVTIAVERPKLFNDTWGGEVLEFVGQVIKCLIIYEDSVFRGPDTADYITDCSTHHLYEQYYYRSTPYGQFDLTWSEFQIGKNYTGLESITAVVEGSWVPRT